MKVFRLTYDTLTVPSSKPEYCGTLAEMKRVAKGVGKELRRHAEVQELDVQSDKAGIVAMLNGEVIIKTTERVWELTPRGALEEVK